MKKNNDYFLLTGASKGIGRATLDLLLEKKEKVIVLVRKKKEIDSYKKNRDIIIFQGDVCNKQIIKKIFQFVNTNKLNIKYLINNAGQRQRKNFLKISDSEIKKIFEVNFFSVFNLCQMFANHIFKKKYNGSIVNISSIVGSLGFRELAGYGSTKAAVNGLTKCLAAEFNGKIRVNSINPGFTKTSFFKNFVKKKLKLYKWTISRTPMSRWGKPEEIAKLIYFLCKEDSSYINGEIINIDGGWSNT